MPRRKLSLLGVNFDSVVTTVTCFAPFGSAAKTEPGRANAASRMAAADPQRPRLQEIASRRAFSFGDQQQVDASLWIGKARERDRAIIVCRSEEGDGTAEFRIESDSLGQVSVPPTGRGGADPTLAAIFQHRDELILRQMITAYAILKKAAATANHKGAGSTRRCATDRPGMTILAGKHDEMFPLHVWMTGSGTQFNMNINEVIANRASIAGKPLGSKEPVHQ
jgi:hypothetical protein